jgi:hypothetical protein
MTNVVNLQISGDLIVDGDANRITRLRESTNSFPHGVRQESALYLCRATKWDYDYTSWPTLAYDRLEGVSARTIDTYTYMNATSLRKVGQRTVKIIGIGASGSAKIYLGRDLSQDRGISTVTWTYANGVLTITAGKSASGDHNSIGLNNKMRTDRRKWSLTQSVAATVNLQFGHDPDSGLPTWVPSDFGKISSSGSYELKLLNTDLKTWRTTKGNCDLTGCYFVGPAPTWEYVPMLEKPVVDLDTLKKKFSDLKAYEEGGQYLPPSLTYNGFSKSGKPRGGTTIYAKLQSQAIKNNRYINTNLPMYFMDIAHAAEDWNNLASQVRIDFFYLTRKMTKKTWKKWLKAAAKESANTYLPLKYGWNLTWAETEQLSQDIQRIWDDVREMTEPRYLGPEREFENLNGSPYFRDIQGIQTFCWQAIVRIQPNSFSGLFAFLDERSMWLTTADAWDWIPYSFVINWLTSVPERLTQGLDFQAWKANYEMVEACRSYKYQGYVSPDDIFHNPWFILELRTNLDVRYYNRSWNRLYDPPMSFNEQGRDYSDEIRRHWVEGGALIIQRT